MKRTVLRFGAIAMATTALGLGVAAASTASIDNTGPDSHQSVKLTNSNTVNLRNHNHLGVNNNNDQHASSGDAKVRDNTTAGDATSGDASNSNDVSTDVTVDNASSMSLGDLFGGSGNDDASIGTTGPDSHNTIEIKNTNKLDVHNDNHVYVNNNNNQGAWTGDASVSHNTTGGDATTGSASNDNSTSTSVSISN